MATVATATHGSYLVEAGSSADTWLIGFHGYAENASLHLKQLRRIPAAEQWLLASVDSLHRFYSRSGEVVGSWMTRQNCLLAIEDNLDYLRQVRKQLEQDFPLPTARYLLGFSQGAAMAYRAAAFQAIPADGVIILAGDVPPDVAEAGPSNLPPVLLARGCDDTLYSQEQLEKDQETLSDLTPRVEVCRFHGEHDWSDQFRESVARFISRESG